MEAFLLLVGPVLLLQDRSRRGTVEFRIAVAGAFPPGDGSALSRRRADGMQFLHHICCKVRYSPSRRCRRCRHMAHVCRSASSRACESERRNGGSSRRKRRASRLRASVHRGHCWGSSSTCRIESASCRRSSAGSPAIRSMLISKQTRLNGLNDTPMVHCRAFAWPTVFESTLSDMV